MLIDRGDVEVSCNIGINSLLIIVIQIVVKRCI